MNNISQSLVMLCLLSAVALLAVACEDLGADYDSSLDPYSAEFAANAGASTFCGGIAGFQCDPDQTCIDDPTDNCDPDNGGADCGGFCVGRPGSAGQHSCGGFTGAECPNPNQICIDDPRDDCDPKSGGADCGGICVGGGH